MNYQISSQHARSDEKLIAGFSSSDDADIFLNKKIITDRLQNKKIIYRLYANSELLREFNPENISVAHASYADGQGCPSDASSLLFHLSLEIQNPLNNHNIGYFNDENDARLFIIEKCEKEYAIKDNDVFCLFKKDVLMETSNKLSLFNQNLRSDAAKNQQTMPTFNPTPLPGRPKPPGGPPDFWIEKEDDKMSD